VKKLTFLLLLLFPLLNTVAQYKGGNGDGYASASVIVKQNIDKLQIGSNLISQNQKLNLYNYTPRVYVNLQLLDVSGKTVFFGKEEYKLHSVWNHLPKGLYFLRHIDGLEIETKKIVKL